MIFMSCIKLAYSDLSELRFRLKFDIFTLTALSFRLGLRGWSIFDSSIIWSIYSRVSFALFVSGIAAYSKITCFYNPSFLHFPEDKDEVCPKVVIKSG